MNTLASALTLAALATFGIGAGLALVASEGERVEAFSAVNAQQPERLLDVAAHLKTRVTGQARDEVKGRVVEVAQEAVDAATAELHRAVDEAAKKSLHSVKARLDAELGATNTDPASAPPEQAPLP